MSAGKLFIALSILIVAGCATTAPQVRLLVAGGEKITVDMKRGVIGAENKDARIMTAGFIANSEKKQGMYVFSVLLLSQTTLKGVKVEDVSDDKAKTLVEDNAPALDGRVWHYACPPVNPDDKDLKWVREIDEGFRVYRFWLTLGDGRQLKIYHAIYYPPFIKFRIRQELGLEKPSTP